MKGIYGGLAMAVVFFALSLGCKRRNIDSPHKSGSVDLNLSRTPVLPIIKDTTNTLTGKVETLTLQYTAWGCWCAPWTTIRDADKPRLTVADHFFLEADTDSLYQLEQHVDAENNYVVVTGQFYKKKDYPIQLNGMKSEETLEKARVFHYSKIFFKHK